MNLSEAIHVSKQGFVLTVCSIILTLLAGLVIGRLLAVNSKTSWLISFGTAICGGSAIATMSPIIDAKEDEISFALATVFALNAIALILFPLIGGYFHLSQSQFGMWSAIAIHDTSSVIGAAQQYGPEALKVATTVKLARALWIIPVSLTAAAIFSRQKGKINFPYFILFFVGAIAAHTFIPELNSIAPVIVGYAHKGLTLALFCIGLGFNKSAWKAASPRPLLLGFVLWLLISVFALYAVTHP
ncbi:UPF0324 membrane protein [Cytophagales bacterium WSM2-2]|nr:UPF0324 membrane protein [Cytophagales bacterium WSM2-2]